MEFTGWGRHPREAARLQEPPDRTSLSRLLVHEATSGQVIPRGAGRSYGDSSLAERLIGVRYFDNFAAFDSEIGSLRCEAGATLEQILNLIIPRGWILPVLPGTRFVTLGGAVASDVHGKNHHRDGCISNFIEEIILMLADGSVQSCSPVENPDLFRATCGGMGLTGVILEVSIKLQRVTSSWIDQQTHVAENLDEAFALFEEHAQSSYSVAWLDCQARGSRLGRSLLFTGEVSEEGDRRVLREPRISAPPYSPSWLLNRYTGNLFNSLYFRMHSTGRKKSRRHYGQFFFPLDGVLNWNRLYGNKGFMQYQFVVPTESAKEAMTEIVELVAASGKGSFLSVLKKMGPSNKNLLSFPLEGYTLALDFKVEPKVFPLMERLDNIVVKAGGRVYLTKDSRMSEVMFKTTYRSWEEFQKVRERIDPGHLFGSLQSKRLGLES